MSENQKATGPVELTEAETDRVAGGDNGKHNAYGHDATPAWSVNGGKADEAPGHL
jgi:hypothetical protein